MRKLFQHEKFAHTHTQTHKQTNTQPSCETQACSALFFSALPVPPVRFPGHLSCFSSEADGASTKIVPVWLARTFFLDESLRIVRRISLGEGGLFKILALRPSSDTGRAGQRSFSAQTPRQIISKPPTGAWPLTLKSGSSDSSCPGAVVSKPMACASLSAATFAPHLFLCKSAKDWSTLPPSCRPLVTLVPAPEASRNSWRRYAEINVWKFKFALPSLPLAMCMNTVTKFESFLRKTSSRNCSKSNSPTFKSSTWSAQTRTSRGFSARPKEISIVSSSSKQILPLTPASSSKYRRNSTRS
mmetsp:Transcript_56022/g.124980  ORF Transcript_56022/g.124980 Transcript_56022/m.124980 type:complete len:300 (-) Transcript_56022:244-1143(-)